MLRIFTTGIGPTNQRGKEMAPLKRQIILGALLRLTGYRFDKSWRQAETGLKAWFYTWSGGTVHINYLANGETFHS